MGCKSGPCQRGSKPPIHRVREIRWTCRKCSVNFWNIQRTAVVKFNQMSSEKLEISDKPKIVFVYMTDLITKHHFLFLTDDKTPFLTFWPWPATLTHDLTQAKVEVDAPTKNQIHGSNGSSMREQRDRCYQMHYLPAAQSSDTDNDINKRCFLGHTKFRYMSHTWLNFDSSPHLS